MIAWKHSAAAVIAASAVLQAHAEFDGPAPVAWRWAQPTSASPSGAPLVAGDVVYAAVGGRVYALERTTGNQVWRFPVAEPIEASFRTGATMSDGLIVAAADNRTVYGIDQATGNLKWQYVCPANISGAPVIQGGHVVVGMLPGSIVSLSAADGTPEWDKPIELGEGLYPNMAVVGDTVVLLTNAPAIHGFNVNAKKDRWSISTSQLSSSSIPAVSGDTVFINTGNYLTALRGSSGGKRWDVRFDEDLAFGPAASPSGVAVVSNNGNVFVLTASGNLVFRKGVALNSSPSASPAFIGSTVVVPTDNGSVNVINPKSGDVVFNYVVPPLFRGARTSATPAGGGNAGGDNRGGNNRGGGGGARGGGGGVVGGGGGGSQDSEEIKYVNVAGPASFSGDTMYVLARDGSLLAFDKSMGVDLTAPSVRMAWPNPGDQISGQAPLELVFLLEDAASGINSDSVKVKINEKEYAGTFTRDGYLSIKISALGSNAPLMDGRANIVVSAVDWLGNKVDAPFALSIDNTLRPIGGPPRRETTNKGNSGGGGPNRGGGGGSLGGG
ncbi:MAG: PQQ-binding-like beta-propeller repeat protein [Armatimonadetes bacterium]|nr:PQQ-binding-like beta-propeller repeat protein [Armatimonadota bacterium]